MHFLPQRLKNNKLSHGAMCAGAILFNVLLKVKDNNTRNKVYNNTIKKIQ